MKKLLLIINPRSGKMKISEHLSSVISIFNRAGYTVESFITEKSGDAREVVKSSGADKDLIVCAGGDGTMNEVATGLMEADLSIPIGYIPSGSTNDFASSLGLASDILAATANIISGKAHEYDLGKFGDKYFSYIASFGAFTRASYATPQSLKNTMGHMAYILEGIKEISQIQPYRVHMELDGRTLEDDFLFVGICNATSIAGVLTLDKSRVDMSDGLFEVLLVRAPKSLSELSDCINGLRYGDFDSYMVKLYRASKIEVRTTPKASWSLDGEMALGADSILVENLPKRLVIVH